MSSTAETPSPGNTSLPQQQCKERKTIVSKILKRSCSEQSPSIDPNQSSSTSTGLVVTSKNNASISDEDGKLYI